MSTVLLVPAIRRLQRRVDFDVFQIVVRLLVTQKLRQETGISAHTANGKIRIRNHTSRSLYGSEYAS